MDRPCGDGWLPRGRDLLAILAMFQFVCATWVFFRARSVAEALGILGRIAAGSARDPGSVAPLPLPGWFYVVLAALLVALEWARRNEPHALRMDLPRRSVRWALYTGLGTAIALFGQTSTVPFIYFQF